MFHLFPAFSFSFSLWFWHKLWENEGLVDKIIAQVLAFFETNSWFSFECFLSNLWYGNGIKKIASSCCSCSCSRSAKIFLFCSQSLIAHSVFCLSWLQIKNYSLHISKDSAQQFSGKQKKNILVASDFVHKLCNWVREALIECI